MRACIFCGGRPLTKEHVWPAWLSERYGNRPLTVERFVHGADPVRFTAKRLDFRARVVCGRCNNGWMSDLENCVKGTFEAIFDRRPFTLLFPGQRVLAVWAMKTAMVMEHTFAAAGSNTFYRQEEREALRETGKLSDDTTILIATSTASRFALSHAIPLQMASVAQFRVEEGAAVHARDEDGGRRPELDVPVVPGHVMTFGLGPLVLQVESNRWKEVTGRVGWPWPRPITRHGDWIHPMGRAIEWPFPQPYDDAMLEELVRAQFDR